MWANRPPPRDGWFDAGTGLGFGIVLHEGMFATGRSGYAWVTTASSSWRLEELHRMLAPMTESGRRGILGENVARAYRLA